VGKTELAKALATFLDRRLVRLQCYEGLDEAKALYEWNYRKQLLRIQAGGGDADEGWSNVHDDIFGEEFLLERPLLTAISAEEPVVLLIDEIDKTDQEFEAMLLELLSDFQISIPELGRIDARTRPVVLLTSNNTRELTEALKRRCLYLWLDYPELEHELAIVKLHAPGLGDDIARRLVEVVAMVRELDLKKPPSIAESIDWARSLLLLGASDLDAQVFRDTMSVIVKHRTDLDVVAERVGVKLSEPVRAASRRPVGAPASTAARRAARRPPAWRPRCSSWARSCAARACRSGPASCSTPSPSCARCAGLRPTTFARRWPRRWPSRPRRGASSTSSSTASSSAPRSWRPSRRAWARAAASTPRAPS
jgi:MoxR-like ATPase